VLFQRSVIGAFPPKVARRAQKNAEKIRPLPRDRYTPRVRASDFDFHLPPEQIAQAPADEREQARLYLLPRDAPAGHARIADLPSLLPPGALLVTNDTRVFPARLRGRKSPTGGAVELLLLERLPHKSSEEHLFAEGEWEEKWRCLGRSSKGFHPGYKIKLDGDQAMFVVVAEVHGAEVDVLFWGHGQGGLLAVAERIGEVPLPPYIGRDGAPSDEDRARYQTVYARETGSAAAPTAGLHFTPRLLAALAARGIERVALTLHVGLGTFAPLRTDEVDDLSELHAERYEIPAATAGAIADARREGRPVIAVGTTTVRALESAWSTETGSLRTGPGTTRLFIKPGHRFHAIDGLLTNFHLPRSTLLMLVAAFAGTDRLLAAYRDAVARGYRFYSFGDAMLIR
jgi:S-adenosylmethionine:tRNA ribosyltransferase-isomerase